MSTLSKVLIGCAALFGAFMLLAMVYSLLHYAFYAALVAGVIYVAIKMSSKNRALESRRRRMLP